MKIISLEKIIYLCKYHDVDTKIAQYVGVKTNQINEILTDLKRNDLYKYYRNLDEFEYEKIIKREKMNNNENAYIFKEEEEIMKDKNKNNNLTDLNDLLFDQLRRLNNENLSQEEFNREIALSKQVVSVSQTIINNANLLLQAKKHFDSTKEKNIAPLLNMGEKDD